MMKIVNAYYIQLAVFAFSLSLSHALISISTHSWITLGIPPTSGAVEFSSPVAYNVADGAVCPLFGHEAPRSSGSTTRLSHSYK